MSASLELNFSVAFVILSYGDGHFPEAEYYFTPYGIFIPALSCAWVFNGFKMTPNIHRCLEHLYYPLANISNDDLSFLLHL